MASGHDLTQVPWKPKRWSGGSKPKPEPSPQQRLVPILAQPFEGNKVVAVLSTKGGVGKTVTAVNLGHTFATLRPADRIVAVDANADAGGLAWRITRQTPATIAQLLWAMASEDIVDYEDVRRYTSRSGSGLEVLAAPDGPAGAAQMDADRVVSVLALLREHYRVVIADCGTGILDEPTQGIVDSSDQLVIVTRPTIDAARAIRFLLGWLGKRHRHLVEQAILVMNAVPVDTGPVNLPAMQRHFAGQVRTVVRIPFDVRLASGVKARLDDLAPTTRQGYIALAAAVAQGLHPRGAQIRKAALAPQRAAEPVRLLTGRRRRVAMTYRVPQVDGDLA